MIALCIAMARLTMSMDHARRRGITPFEMQQTISQEPDKEARRVARTVAWYVYEANADSGITSRQLAAEVQTACEATQEKTP